jgi:hypothetical protein
MTIGVTTLTPCESDGSSRQVAPTDSGTGRRSVRQGARDVTLLFENACLAPPSQGSSVSEVGPR